MPAAFNALQRTAGLKPEVMGDLADTDGQIPVGMQAVGVNHHMMRTVHRPQHEAFPFHLHGREHVLLIVVPMAAGLIEFNRTDAGRHNMLVTQHPFLGLDVVFQLHPDRIPLGQEHRQPLADQVVRHEQAHVLADPAMVAGLGFFLLDFPGLELVLAAESDTVQPRQHLVFLVILPVGAGQGCQLECFQGLGVCQMRADAHVDVVALLVEGNHCVLGQVVDMLHLVNLAAVLHQLDCLVPGQRINLEWQVFLHDFLHFCFDGRQILFCQLDVPQVNIIVKALFRRGAVGKMGIGIQALHGLSHNMGCRVAQYLQFLLCRAFRCVSVVVDDFHVFPSLYVVVL